MAIDRTEYLEPWKHGFIRVDAKKRRTYYIREMVNGRRFKRSTRAHTFEGAMEAYEAWVKDPAAFARGEHLAPRLVRAGLRLTQSLIDEFLEWSKTTGHRGYGNSVGHVANQRIAMDFWKKALGHLDLRSVQLESDVHPALRGRTQQTNRRRTLKAFYSWLRSETGGNRIKLAEDPVARRLEVRVSNPNRREKLNKAVPWSALLKVRDGATVAGKKVKGLQGHWRAIFVVQMATGWHASELKRFAQAGFIEDYAGPQKGAAAVLVVAHKSGAQHRTAVDAACLKAAKEMLEYGSFEPANYSREVAHVAKEVGAVDFTAGQLRHSVATKMINDGADLASVSTFLGHRSPETTKRFYATHAVPKNPSLMLSRSSLGG